MENKTGKSALPAGRYFKYALGEIVLVVIGILIALQINNWNEERKGKHMAKQYAKDLVRDLIQDTLALNQLIKFQNETSNGLDTLITFKNKDLYQSSINDSLHVLFRKYCMNIGTFKNNENTLSQLKSAGELVLFNEAVKDSIISFEMSISELIKQGEFYRSAYKSNRTISKKILDYSVFLDSTYFKKGNYTGKMLPKGYYTDNTTRELFNELAILKAISANYLNNYLKLHLNKTENLIQLLTI
ncbi:DUF6090 family protein [Lutimonas halocynthiae]|uniref:DUF6090 family protein n=1 Tax=Lutimonas halocynthiae TaxID=1446477 RepID=UPI0025B39420|nr:DUF6090 family protein [Lutimonas halocynthiae]MDN3643191.1 DUF6090 family protein [Lutimonas halocynthiae]